MTDHQRENLSAGMDGQLSKEELRFLLRRLDHDASLQQELVKAQIAQAVPLLAGRPDATELRPVGGKGL